MIKINKQKEYLKEWYQKNKKRIKENAIEYYLLNKKKIKERIKKYREKNKETISNTYKKWVQKNKEKRALQCSKYCILNKEKIKEYHRKYNKDNKEKAKQYREKNKETIKKKNTKWYKENRTKYKEKYKKYYLENKELRLIYGKNYNKENRNKINEYSNKRHKIRMKIDVIYRITKSIRGRIKGVLNGINKSTKTLELLGCTGKEFKKYLEGKFQFGMSWENYGFKGWHIDHILPCASFDLSKENEQKKCFNYKNLQPLWCYDNFKKGNKLLTIV